MSQQEFQQGMAELIEAYPGHPPGKNWPKQRLDALWDGLRGYDPYFFRKAVRQFIANSYNPPKLADLKELIHQIQRDEKVERRLGAEEMDRLHPVQANAKELADKYAPAIRAIIRQGITRPLPYDPASSVAEQEDDFRW